MKSISEYDVVCNEGRHGVFFRVLTSLTFGLTVGLSVVCSLIWADQGIHHARLVDRETLISLTGYIIFLVVVHAMGVFVTPFRSLLPAFTFAMSLVISFAVDMVTASIATRRYQELSSEGPSGEAVRESWMRLSLPQRDALQVELNCCGFAEPADDLFETVVCHPEAELPGCHLPWKDFLSYQAVGVATAFFAMAAMHALLLVFVAGIIDKGLRKGRNCYPATAASLDGNRPSSTTLHGKTQPGDRGVSSMLSTGSRRSVTGWVPPPAEGGQTHGMPGCQAANGPSTAATPLSGAHFNMPSVTFDLPSMSSATNSPSFVQPAIGHSSIVNPRDSHGSTLSADSFLSTPPCCHCTGSRSGHRLDSRTNDRRSHIQNTRPSFCRPELWWEVGEASENARLSRATAGTHAAPKAKYPPYSRPSTIISPSSSATPSYHTAGEDSGTDRGIGEMGTTQFDVLRWGEEIEKFITGTAETGARRSTNAQAVGKRSTRG